jgi:hypothetical protein
MAESYPETGYTRRVVRRSRSLAAGALLAAAAACAPPTQIVVVVASDLRPGEEIARVEVRTFDESGAQLDLRAVDVAAAAVGPVRTLPFSFGAVPRAGATQLAIEVLGFAPGAEDAIVVQRRVAPFVAGETRRLVIRLDRACSGPLPCAPDETCSLGACEGARLDATALDPVVPGHELELDAGIPDSGAYADVPERDAGPLDAGPRCPIDPRCRAAVRVEVGDGFACWLDYSEVVVCFGPRNDLGQLGDSTTTPSLSPVPIAAYGGMRSLVVGEAFACVTSESALLCWGDNGVGQLARGAGAPPSSPTPSEAAGAAPRLLFDGPRGACGIVSLADGEGAVCWGAPIAGAATPAETCGAEPCALAPSAQPAFDAAELLSTSGAHTCVVREGVVQCAGVNEHGQLGDGTRTARSSLAPALGLAPVRSIAAGARATCAVVARGVECWGANDLGQLGSAAMHDDCAAAGGPRADCSPVPVAVAATDDAVEVVAAGETFCMRRASGAVACWGADEGGAIGDGPGSPSTCTRFDGALVPCAREPRSLSDLDAIDLDGRGSTFCAALRDGDVRCWGTDWGQAPALIGAP